MDLTISQNMQWALVGLYSILIIATLTQSVLQQRNTQADFSELRQRIHSWWIMVTIFTVAILLSRTVSIIFFAIVSFLALKEYLSIIPTRRADRRVLFWAYLTIPLQYYWISEEWYGMFIIFVPVYVFLFLPIRMVLIGDTKNFLRAIGTLHWGVMMLVFGMSHVAYLLVLPSSATVHTSGPELVLYLVFLTQFNDVAQYIWGKTFGDKKIVPNISPKKTWAGFLGGVGTTIILANLLGPFLTPMDWKFSTVAGALISIGGFMGDVTISAVKRDIGIKDGSSMIPGNGGILDRVDSLTYTAPLFFHYLYYFYY